jgi:hypothetical protein
MPQFLLASTAYRELRGRLLQVRGKVVPHAVGGEHHEVSILHVDLARVRLQQQTNTSGSHFAQEHHHHQRP